jgi:hypothetical protein
MYTFDMTIWSDLHKDAYGFRPRDGARIAALTDDEKQAEWDRMIRDLDREMEREQIAQQEATVAFEELVAGTIANGAGDRATAIRWLLDALTWAQGDIGALEYEHGLPFNYLRVFDAELGRWVEKT